MTGEEFLRAFETQLEVPEGSLKKDQVLTELDSWDSLAAVLFIGLADEKLGIAVSGNQIAHSKTIGDLLALLGSRLSG